MKQQRGHSLVTQKHSDQKLFPYLHLLRPWDTCWRTSPWFLHVLGSHPLSASELQWPSATLVGETPILHGHSSQLIISNLTHADNHLLLPFPQQSHLLLLPLWPLLAGTWQPPALPDLHFHLSPLMSSAQCQGCQVQQRSSQWSPFVATYRHRACTLLHSDLQIFAFVPESRGCAQTPR